jgi:hypothetical protein
MKLFLNRLNLSKKDLKRAEPSEVFYNLPQHKKVLHIGGHLGFEARFYNDVVFVEPIPKYANFLRELGYKVIEGAICGNELYLTSYDQASSILVPIEHKVVSTIKVKNYSLDDINDNSFDMLVIDTQGSELVILKSGRLNFNYIVVEASSCTRYINAGTKKEIEDFLILNNYKKIKEFQHGKHDITDLIFEKIL